MNETQAGSGAGQLTGDWLAGRHAAVTGATRGIGAVIAETLASLGADVTLMGRNEALLAERQADFKARFPGNVVAQPTDVADAASVEAGFAEAVEANGAIEILVNNAGIAGSAPFHRMELDHWNNMLATNLTGAFLCTRQVYPAMRKAGWGRIVNVASTAGLKGYAYIAAYTASKHGLIGLTRALALEAAKTGVTVNALCPGYADTDIVAGTIENIVAKTGRSAEEALAELTVHNPQARLIQPHEVADTVAWLCLDSAASVTGQAIAIAGGEVM
jgi:NAD(P)-dependent dehydrogenase (short-subunit alcohol dehydrogenase family)